MNKQDYDDVQIEFREDWALDFLGWVAILVGAAGVALALTLLNITF